VDPAKVKLMLAERCDAPFSRAGWTFELKYDGFRLLAAREGDAVRLVYRSGAEATPLFPEVVRALQELPHERFVVDGEVVVLDEEGRPSFQGLQKRCHLQNPLDIRRAAARLPATMVAFDVLALGGFDARPLPLRERKSILRALMTAPCAALRVADDVEEHGRELFAEVQRRGLEGVVAKRLDAPYTGGRAESWLKIRAERTGDFVVVGFTPGTGSRNGFGALQLAAWSGDALVYAGRVGSGFSEDEIDAVRNALEAVRRTTAPCAGTLPRVRGQVWVEPRLVCEVRYREWTEAGQLRMPVFVRFRDDKAAEECVLERGSFGVSSSGRAGAARR